MSTKILQAAPDPELERLLKVERLAFERYDRLRGYSVWRKEAAEQDRPHLHAHQRRRRMASYGLRQASRKNLLNVVSYFPVGVVLENGFLRLQQLDHLAEFLRPDVA